MKALILAIAVLLLITGFGYLIASAIKMGSPQVEAATVVPELNLGVGVEVVATHERGVIIDSYTSIRPPRYIVRIDHLIGSDGREQHAEFTFFEAELKALPVSR